MQLAEGWRGVPRLCARDSGTFGCFAGGRPGVHEADVRSHMCERAPVGERPRFPELFLDARTLRLPRGVWGPGAGGRAIARQRQPGAMQD